MDEILNEMEVAEMLFECLEELPTELLDRLSLVCNIILESRKGTWD